MGDTLATVIIVCSFQFTKFLINKVLFLFFFLNLGIQVLPELVLVHRVRHFAQHFGFVRGSHGVLLSFVLPPEIQSLRQKIPINQTQTHLGRFVSISGR